MRKKIHIVPIVILFILLLGLFYLSTYSLTKIEVNGCIMSSEDEIRNVIEEKAIFGNTLLLYLNNKWNGVDKVSFVAKLDITYVDKHTVSVDVYEKSVAGCIEYMESYVYFDKDGIVLETAKQKYDDVPYIKGLTVKSWQMDEKLPIENKKKFDMILNITQLIDKYDLDIQGIEFTADGEVILWHKNVEIELGDGSNIAIQLMNLGNILDTDGLGDKTGTLYMKDYSKENPVASFKIK